MLLYPMKRCLSAICDARAFTACRAEPVGMDNDRVYYRATLSADVGFSRPVHIVGLCVSGHDCGPLYNIPPKVLDAFDHALCFDRPTKPIHIHLLT